MEEVKMCTTPAMLSLVLDPSCVNMGEKHKKHIR